MTFNTKQHANKSILSFCSHFEVSVYDFTAVIEFSISICNALVSRKCEIIVNPCQIHCIVNASDQYRQFCDCVLCKSTTDLEI